MATNADWLHAKVFGKHVDTCPGCGNKHRCSEIDCQGNTYCISCMDPRDFEPFPEEIEKDDEDIPGIYNPLHC